jgi:DNA-binding transcriptional ArsR family regulator
MCRRWPTSWPRPSKNASRHLGVLTQAGLLARRRDGRVVWYRVANPAAFALIEATVGDVLDELRTLDPDA